MDPDPAKIPIELLPLASALELAFCRPDADGWRAPEFRGAPVAPLVPNAPPFDGVFRGSWISPGVCLRFDLSHPVVPAALRERLAADFPAQVGEDGGFYEFGVSSSSQYTNRQTAILELALKVAGAPKADAGLR